MIGESNPIDHADKWLPNPFCEGRKREHGITDYCSNFLLSINHWFLMRLMVFLIDKEMKKE